MSDVGDNLNAENAGWSFAGDTSRHFDEHVSKSIPLYHEGHRLIRSISDFFLSDDSICYDLGCATGTLLRQLAEHHRHRKTQFVGIDSEADMVFVASRRCLGFEHVELYTEDLIDLELQPTDLVISYYTMQFVKPKHRQAVFDKIYQASNWGGGFLLFEKVRGPDARFQDMLTTLYNDYKSEQGYSGDEIVAKTRSLKGVLEPFSTEGNLGLLRRAGYEDITTVMKYMCFEGFLAIK